MAIRRYKLVFTGKLEDDAKVYKFFNTGPYRVEIFDNDGYATFMVRHSSYGLCKFEHVDFDSANCNLTEVREGTTVYKRRAYKNGPYVFTYE